MDASKLPHSLEAEVAILGSIAVDPDAFDAASEIIGEDDFFQQSHSLVFSAMRSCRDSGTPPDIMHLLDWFQKKNRLEEVGGVAALTGLADTMATAGGVEHYAKIVKDKARLRRIIRACADIGRMGMSGDVDVADYAAQAETAIFDACQVASIRRDIDMRSVCARTLGVMEAAQERQEAVGVVSGYRDLDALTGGFRSSALTLVAARPSMGKSSLLLNMMENMAKDGKKVAFISLEMSAEDLTTNLLCGMAGVESTRARQGTMSLSQWKYIGQATHTVSQWQCWIEDCPSLSIDQLKSKARRLHSQCGLDVVAVDYLQLLKPPKATGTNRERQVAEISAGLKSLAMELDIPVVAAAQLKRESEKRDNHRPTLADLRESGSLEQDADLVVLIHRQGYYDRDNREVQDQAELIVAKNRTGPTGTVTLSWDGPLMRFSNREYNDDDDAFDE
jgi:replicative DNA helicase